MTALAGWLANTSWSSFSTNAREPPQVQGCEMETLEELGTGIHLCVVFLRRVWILCASILRHILRDTGTWIEVSTPLFFYPPILTSTT
jgi:hypothetical protein